MVEEKFGTERCQSFRNKYHAGLNNETVRFVKNIFCGMHWWYNWIDGSYVDVLTGAVTQFCNKERHSEVQV